MHSCKIRVKCYFQSLNTEEEKYFISSLKHEMSLPHNAMEIMMFPVLAANVLKMMELINHDQKIFSGKTSEIENKYMMKNL